MASCTHSHKLAESFPGRSHETEEVLRLLSVRPCLATPLHVHGPPCTGKTSVLRAVLRDVGACVARLGPLDCDGTVSHLWTRIVNCWRAQLQKSQSKVDDIGDVSNIVKKLQKTTAKPFYIVIDPVDPTINSDNLSVLLRFPELVNAPVGIILVSVMPWQCLFTRKAVLEPMPAPLMLHFHAYTARDLEAILARLDHDPIPSPLFKTCIARVVKQAYMVSRQLSDIQLLLSEVLPTLREVYEQRGPSCGTSDLISGLNPVLDSLMLTFCENYPGAACEMASDASRGIDKASHVKAAATFSTPLQVPYFSKFLLIAAFLAASNRAASDRRVFCAQAGPTTSRRTTTQAMDRQQEAAAQEAVGQGQVFSLERWLQLFWKLIMLHEGGQDCGEADGVWLHRGMQSANMLHQIRHLVGVKLVVQVGNDMLDGASFVCNVTHELAEDLARNLRLELRRFLTFV